MPQGPLHPMGDVLSKHLPNAAEEMIVLIVGGVKLLCQCSRAEKTHLDYVLETSVDLDVSLHSSYRVRIFTKYILQTLFNIVGVPYYSLQLLLGGVQLPLRRRGSSGHANIVKLRPVLLKAFAELIELVVVQLSHEELDYVKENS